MLHEFILANRVEIITRTRQRVAARPAPRATEEELERGIPLFLDQLIVSLQLSQSSSRAMERGGDPARREPAGAGFSIGQVVHDYGGVCQAVTELANETSAAITADEFLRSTDA